VLGVGHGPDAIRLDSLSHRKDTKNAKGNGNGKNKGQIEEITGFLVDAMLKVRRVLGPGLLESAYQACLAQELRCRGIDVGYEVAMPVRYGANGSKRVGNGLSAGSSTSLALLATSR
jgi:hypothetical protein